MGDLSSSPGCLLGIYVEDVIIYRGFLRIHRDLYRGGAGIDDFLQRIYTGFHSESRLGKKICGTLTQSHSGYRTRKPSVIRKQGSRGNLPMACSNGWGIIAIPPVKYWLITPENQHNGTKYAKISPKPPRGYAEWM